MADLILDPHELGLAVACLDDADIDRVFNATSYFDFDSDSKSYSPDYGRRRVVVRWTTFKYQPADGYMRVYQGAVEKFCRAIVGIAHELWGIQELINSTRELSEEREHRIKAAALAVGQEKE